MSNEKREFELRPIEIVYDKNDNDSGKRDLASITSGSESHYLADRNLRNDLKTYSNDVMNYVDKKVDNTVKSTVDEKEKEINTRITDMFNQTTYVKLRVPTIGDNILTPIENESDAKKKQGFIWLDENGDGYGK